MSKHLTVLEQIEVLRKISSPRFLEALLTGMFFFGLFLIVFSFWNKNGIIAIFGCFFFIVSLASFSTVPFIRQAYFSWKESRPESGKIEIKSVYDSEDILVMVWVRNQIWEFRSHRTIGWTPIEEKEYQPQIFFYRKNPWPSLVVTEVGILYPYSKPRLIET